MAMLMCATTLPNKDLNLHFFNGETPKNLLNSHLNLLPTSSTKHRCSVVKSSSETHNLPGSNKRLSKHPIISHGRDDDESHGLICPGCGVFMQDSHPNLPGFFLNPKPKTPLVNLTQETLIEDDDETLIQEDSESEFDEDSDFQEDDDDFDWDSGEEDEDEQWKKELDGFAPVGVGYGNVTEETLSKLKRTRISKAEKKRKIREEAKRNEEEEEAVVVCARCHSLRNYGQVKNPNADNLIPDFDFDRLITTRLMKPTSNSDASVVVMVVDCVDFDASFPKRAAKSLFKSLEGRNKDHSKLKLPKLVLVATKVDLLPSQISPTRLDRWVRNRAKANGAPKLSGVYLVSARKDLGVRNLLAFIKELAGPRGSVWVIGSQNAGKSTLINAFSKKEGKKMTKLTEAAVPGTTLGILRIAGILPAKAKMYDTPGLLHPYLMSMRLNRDEQKLVEIRKELKPRSYRIKARQAIHVGGLLRLDLNQASVETIYVTVWASPNVSLHLGKIENSEDIWTKHAGTRLQPPVGEDRIEELGKWEQVEHKVSGISWDVNAVDIAVAGLGWLSIGLKGEATLGLWTYDGIQVTLREPLVLDRATFLERPGFLLPKAVSEALGKQSKEDAEKRKRLEDSLDSLSQVV
ncbi:GTP-binding protein BRASSINAZOLE INSENSITIVE PALE GREEN 2 [Ranunculus cassubicifolius]